MAIFSLFKCNQSNRIDVRIGDGTVKISTILTVRAMLTSKKYSGGQEINRGAKTKIEGNALYALQLETRLNATSAIAKVALCPPLHPNIPIKPSKGILSGDAEWNFLEPEQLGKEDDIMNFIGVQDGRGFANMQNVFGKVSYFTG